MVALFEIFKAYSGVGYYSIIFVAALVYLWFVEENKVTRYLFVYGAGCIQILFFIPLFYWGYTLLDSETYYRILWLLPSTVVIAYSAVRIMGKHTKVGLLITLVIVVISGKYVYSSVYITEAENLYQIPQEVVDVCDMIMPQEGEDRIWAIFPDDMIHYVRQYSTDIQMLYGREVLVNGWEWGDHELHIMMTEDIVDVETLVTTAEEYACNYIILEKDRPLDGDTEKNNLLLVGETSNYLVYQCVNVEVPIEPID
ncbi:MAG: hypothetical protein R3Y24_07865 [Eubacteriales bacterium]